jgi:uncharacterized protein (DUF2235 family)
MKRIVICTDGTWNKPDQQHDGKRTPSNVVKMARAVLPVGADGTIQVTYYDSGVGTGTITDKVVGGVTGKGLSDNVVQAYRFLSHNYVPGDEIFLFGFSRGAYTARSIAGLINRIGVLPKKNIFFMNEAYELYKGRDNQNKVDAFRSQQESQHAEVKFIGVWDTVGALGIPTRFLGMLTRRKYTFHDVSLSSCVKNGYQALAIDERRKPFKPSLWKGSVTPDQRIEQRWFAGVHTNIGGGYDDGGLSNIALHWIKDKAVEHNLDIDKQYLGFFRPHHIDTLYDSKKWYYIGSHVRELFTTSSEAVDESVCKRIKDVDDYKPENVPDSACAGVTN